MTETFEVLDDRSHVLRRFNMYGGSTTCEPHSGIINFKYQEKRIVPALIKIIEEIYQNSIEEYIKTSGEFATEISLDITSTLSGTEITIKDNGRGIPQELITGVGIPRPVVAWTVLRAGTNFDDATRKGASANGLGSVLTNIMSTSFIGQTCDGKSLLTVTCSDNMSKISHSFSKCATRGTTVKFIPDLTRFGITEFDQDHIDILRDRFNNLAILYPGIKFTFCSEKIQFKNIKVAATKFHESAIGYQHSENMSFIFAPSGTDEEFRLLSYVNGLYIKNGGSHVDYFLNNIISELRTSIKKKFKIDVLPNQLKQHILFASWITDFPALKVDSQSKERVTNSVAEVAEYFSGIDFEKISRQLLNTPAIIDPAIAAILYKKELQERQELAKKTKAVAKLRIVNHIAATDPNPENRTLFIAEGLCIHEDVEVFTLDGSKKIKDVSVGDVVLTHKNNFREVVAKSFALKPGIKINGVIYSPQHRLYIYDVSDKTFKFLEVQFINKTIHKLVHNRLIENGFRSGLHIVKRVKKNMVTTNKDIIEFSKTHEILWINGDCIGVKTVNDLLIGDVIIL